MAKVQAIEGTRDELQERLRSFPREQRFRLTPLTQPQEGNGDVTAEPSLAELFAGRVGRFHFGDANLSRDSGSKFSALVAEKKRKGRL